MAVRIITDSTSDISLDRQEELGIEIVPLTVRFGGEDYLDGVTLTKQEFYEKLKNSTELPTTSQVNPETFVRVFEKYNGGDEIVGIFISGKLSGTCQSAVIAKQILGRENIHIVDSLNVTFALGLLVYEAVRLRDEGLNAQEICARLRDLMGRLRFYAMLDTLKYLKMGGRLSASSALLGTMLRIKPIITLKDGLVEVCDKKQGQRAAMEEIAQKVRTDPPAEGHVVAFGDSVSPEMTSMLKELLADDIDLSSAVTLELGAVVGTHGGPGCAGIAYIARD
jgi:DegV family protein with EDD domain